MTIQFEQKTPGEPYYTITSDGDGDTYIARNFWVETILMGGGNDFVALTANGLAGTGQNQHYLERDPFVDMGSGNDDLLISGEIVTGGGTGTYFGGDGNDVISFSAVPYPFDLTNPSIVHFIYGDDDSLDTTGHGNDSIFAGEERAYIDGGGGIDLLSYSVLLSGGIVAKLPEITPGGGQTPGFVVKEAGVDTILRVEALWGTSFDDFLSGSQQGNELRGGGGNDIIFGLEGGDDLYGDEGRDSIFGGDGDDLIHGGAQADRLYADDGNDFVDAGSGNDFVALGAGFDEADGGTGTDTISYAAARGPVVVNLFEGTATTLTPAGEEHDTLIGFENIKGSVFDDALGGNAAANRITGGVGDDILAGLDGNDTLLGQRGGDLILGNRGDDYIRGGNGNDLIDAGIGDDDVGGGRGDDYLFGSDGDDTLSGGRRNDELRGGTGTDTMTGGFGQDQFIWRAEDLVAADLDVIADFSPILDSLVLVGIFDPSTAAEDVLTAVQVGSGVVLTADLSGTPAGGSSFSVDDLVFLEGYTLDMVDLAVWQAFDAIEFI